MSPTICSTMSSIETRPSVPPYSSTTSARWMRVACIFSSRSSAGIDGGTNSISRMILVDDSGIARSIAPRSRPAMRASCAWTACSGSTAALRGHERDQVADVDHAHGIVERVVVDHEARVAGLLEHLHQLAERNVLLHRDDVAARHHDVLDPAPAQRQDVADHGALFRRHAGFAGAGGLQHHLDVGAGRSVPPAEQRASEPREEAVAVAVPACAAGTGRLRFSFWLPTGSAGRLGVSALGMVSVNSRVGIRDGETLENLALHPLHLLPRRGRCRGHSPADAETREWPDARDGG